MTNTFGLSRTHQFVKGCCQKLSPSDGRETGTNCHQVQRMSNYEIVESALSTTDRAGFTKCGAPITRASEGPQTTIFLYLMYLPFQLALECVGPSQRQGVGSGLAM